MPHTIVRHFYTLAPSGQPVELPFVVSAISAGFPSPAEEYLRSKISLDEMLVHNATATIIVEVSGDSMQDAGILDGSKVIVDRSKEAVNGDVVVAVVGNEFLVKYVDMTNGRIQLYAANPHYKRIHLDSDNGDFIWGVVTANITIFRKK